ncbi:sigma-70 family RNA polymerase sigma factor [Luteimonas sp. 3794]|uniref:sigma-70 family RNA polymerase sigma factor n=1 Tax=Luteimonas sp. 3794 TaxID=2817730 RepID=UPI002862E605|nr:sigma-70 family RNA polymerase sigma factor [Luteimonas sp. 3794]MDR6992735.1 RNA polymerase sigma-70 factor (ECF subfamily) [Luteimonas sp. 3794]
MSKFLADPAPDAAFWSEQMTRVAADADVDCFMRIYDHFAPRLKRYLLGQGIASAQAEDLVQEAMLRLWRRARSFDGSRASLGTWLFRIARNLHIDSLRRGASATAWPDDVELLQDDEDGELGTSGPEAFTDHVGLGRAIDALPVAQARLIRMSYLESKSHSEISNELGMPLGSVKSTLRRAFAKLRRGLGGEA